MLPKIVEALKTDPTGWYKANKLNPALVAWYGHSPARRLDEATPDQHQRDSAAQEEHSTGGGHRDSMAMTERDQSRKRWTHFATLGDRKRVVEGTGVSVRVDLGGHRILKKKKTNQ